MDDTILRRTWAEIDLDALAHNYHQARRLIGPGVRYLGAHGGRKLCPPCIPRLPRKGAPFSFFPYFPPAREVPFFPLEIGRASCRERV